MAVRGPSHGLWHGAGAVAVGALAAMAVVLLADVASPRGATPRGGPSSPDVSKGALVVMPTPYNLYTHCGVDEARIGDQYFEAVHPLSDGSGNPPAGWGNPYQAGTMKRVSPAVAVFTDTVGHRVTFRLRAGATSFRHVCS